MNLPPQGSIRWHLLTIGCAIYAVIGTIAAVIVMAAFWYALFTLARP